MAGSVRNKIRLGTLFLFALLVLQGGVSIYFLLHIRKDTTRILKANYESIGYCTGMQRQLDSLLIRPVLSVARFDSLLRRQEANITEPGETTATRALRLAFTGWQSAAGSNAPLQLRRYLQQIIHLNLQAIQRKSLQAEANAEDATTAIVLLSTLSVIVGLSFAYSFPGVVVDPVNRLMEAIREISNKNYTYRIHLDNERNEFGQLAASFNGMAERLEYFENSNLNKILFEKARAEAVINSLKDASIGIDKNGTILFANNQALQLLGAAAKNLVGAPASQVSRHNDLFRFLLEDGGSTPFKIVVDNRENYFTKELIDIAQGDSNSRVIVLKNITSFKELDVAKNNFIATISHELKTPLAATDFSLKLLEDSRVGTLSADQKELVQQLKNDNQRMLKILSELLNLSQVDAGKIQLHITRADLSAIIQSSVQAVSTAARARGVTILPTGDPITDIALDADKISWVINNFLTNAIQFSPAGGTITIHTLQTGGKVSVSVQDQGPGIEEQYFDRIFERFFQIPGRSHKKGSGIGLAICKELVLAMGGQIWVRSRLQEGSTFGFDLQQS